MKESSGKAISLSESKKDEVMDIIYQILKQEPPESLSEAKQFFTKVQKFSDSLPALFSSTILIRALEKVVKGEKWHCCVLFRLFIQLCKDEAFLKKETRYFFERILRMELWKSRHQRDKEAWTLVQNGMVAFISHYGESIELFKSIRDKGPRSVGETFRAEPIKAYFKSMSKK